MRLGLALSAAVHAGTAAALLLPWAGGDRLPVPMPPIEVELIQSSTAGAALQPAAEPAVQPVPVAPPVPSPPSRAAQPARPSPVALPLSAAPPEAASAASPQSAASQPAASQPGASQPGASQPVAPQPATPHPAAPALAAVNLGNGGQDLADLNARSDDIIPPRPDSRHRNLPPAYPADAMRRHQAGTVHLMIQVTADGIPVLVEVAGSSGHPSLDQAAVQAVEQWRFTPARSAAGPVPFSFTLDIHFVGDRT